MKRKNIDEQISHRMVEGFYVDLNVKLEASTVLGSIVYDGDLPVGKILKYDDKNGKAYVSFISLTPYHIVKERGVSIQNMKFESNA